MTIQATIPRDIARSTALGPYPQVLGSSAQNPPQRSPVTESVPDQVDVWLSEVIGSFSRFGVYLFAAGHLGGVTRRAVLTIQGFATGRLAVSVNSVPDGLLGLLPGGKAGQRACSEKANSAQKDAWSLATHDIQYSVIYRRQTSKSKENYAIFENPHFCVPGACCLCRRSYRRANLRPHQK